MKQIRPALFRAAYESEALVPTEEQRLMNSPGLVKYAGALAALAIFSACGGGSTVAPSTGALNFSYVGRTLSVNGRLVTAARPPSAPLRYATILPDGRTILPDAHKKSKDFEYIIGDYGSYASIFDYPKSIKQVGTINNVGGQGCTNVLYGYGKKTFWIVAAYNQVEEFSVPDTSIKKLSVPNGSPSSCAMDAGGDLAVGILYGSGSGGGDVDIFNNATGKPTIYKTALDEEFFDGYDNQGNLFADGFTGDRSGFALVELPKGSTKFVTITTSNVVDFPGSVQWDGKYLTVFDQLADNFYQYHVSGTTAVLQGTVSITEADDCAQTWNAGSLVYCGDNDGAGRIYNYPAGGAPVANFSGHFDFPLGVTAAAK
jgi:hypothetical protein